MLRLDTADVRPLEELDVSALSAWLVAGFRDLQREAHKARAFAPLHLLVGHAEVGRELAAIYAALPGAAQSRFRCALDEAIRSLSPISQNLAVFRALLQLAGRIRAAEVLPSLASTVGRGFFGLPDVEGRDAFALALDIVTGMAPAPPTAHTLRCLVTGKNFKSSYAPLALVGLCIAEPENLLMHVELLRPHFQSFHDEHGRAGAVHTARRVAHAVPLVVLGATLPHLRIQLDASGHDRWLVDALFGFSDSPLEIVREGDTLLVARRGQPGHAPVACSDAAMAESLVQLLKCHTSLEFEHVIELLPATLEGSGDTRTVFRLLRSGEIPLRYGIARMAQRLAREERESFHAIANRKRAQHSLNVTPLKAAATSRIAALWRQLIELVRELDDDSAAELASRRGASIGAIAHLLAVWQRHGSLAQLVRDMKAAASYQLLVDSEHGLVELEALARNLGGDNIGEEEAEEVYEATWRLVKGGQTESAALLTTELTPALRVFLVQLAAHLELFVGVRRNQLRRDTRRKLLLAAERILGNLPGTYSRGFEMLDLVWRAVLLSKAGLRSRAAALSMRAVELLTTYHDGPSDNAYVWWSRAADAYRLVAEASGDREHYGWVECMRLYERAAESADARGRALSRTRMVQALVSRLRQYRAPLPRADAAEVCELAEYGCALADTLVRSSVFVRFLVVQLRAMWAAAVTAAYPEDSQKADDAEAEFLQAAEGLLSVDPAHAGTVLLVWRYRADRGDVDTALAFLDERVGSLRTLGATGPSATRSRGVADYLEWYAARALIDFDRIPEARARLVQMVTTTQPRNQAAAGDLLRIGVEGPMAEIASQLYQWARGHKPEQAVSGTRPEPKVAPSGGAMFGGEPSSSDERALVRYGRTLLRTAEIRRGIAILDEVANSRRADPYVLYHLADGYFRLSAGDGGDVAPAQQYEYATIAAQTFEKAWKLEPRVETALRLASVWSRLGSADEVRRYSEAARRLNPDDGRTAYALGCLSLRAGNAGEAVTYWSDALRLLLDADSSPDARAVALASHAASAVVRFGSVIGDSCIAWERLGATSLRTLASALIGTGWHRGDIVASMVDRLEELPAMTRLRVPHAVRAHLLYLQLTEDRATARAWHEACWDRMRRVTGSQLLIEYAAGAKTAFRRAALWALGRRVTGAALQKFTSQEKCDEARWGAFVSLTSKLEYRSSYYREAYEAWPRGQVDCDELWRLMWNLNGRLFVSACEQVGLTAGEQGVSSALVTAANHPVEQEVLRLRDLDARAPEKLVQADELSLRVLLGRTRALVERHARAPVRQHWVVEPHTVRRVCADTTGVPPEEVHSLDVWASRVDGSVASNSAGGIDVVLPIWSEGDDEPEASIAERGTAMEYEEDDDGSATEVVHVT